MQQIEMLIILNFKTEFQNFVYFKSLKNLDWDLSLILIINHIALSRVDRGFIEFSLAEEILHEKREKVWFKLEWH